MTRPKKRAPEEQPSTGPNKLLEALKFLALITKEEGSPIETHIIIFDKRIIAYNGIIGAGQLIEEDLYACPHNHTMVEALAKCGEHISFTQLDNHRLSIKSGKFKALVPCLEFGTLQSTNPDSPIVGITDVFKQAMEAVNVIPSVEDNDNSYGVSILMNGKSLIATDGKIMFEYWHGIDLPPNLVVPKTFGQILTKTPKKLSKFGFSQSSVTFYFEDDSWIKSQLYAKPWPDVSKILDRPSEQKPLPPDFFKGVAAVAPFSPDGKIHFSEGLVHSHPSRDVGAQYEVLGLPGEKIFLIKQLMLIKPYAQTIDFFVKGEHNSEMTFFQGMNMRGAIAGHLK